LGEKDMPNVPKNRRGSKKLEGDDTRSEEIQTERVEVTAPIRIVSIAINPKGFFFGLGDDGKVYKLTEDNNNWVTIQ
jgi:hypothetical protein